MELVKILISKGERKPKHFYKDGDVKKRKLFEWEFSFNPTMKNVEGKGVWNFGGGVEYRNGNGIFDKLFTFFHYKYIGWLWRYNAELGMFQVIPSFSENSNRKEICNIDVNIKIGIKLYINDGKIVCFISRDDSDDVYIEYFDSSQQINIIKELPFQLNSLTRAEKNIFVTLNRKFT